MNNLICCATTDTQKYDNLRRELSPYQLDLHHVPLNLPLPPFNDLPTMAEEQCKYAWQQIQKPIITFASGFYIFSLNGFPKVHLGFALETIGLNGVLKLMEGKDRSCEWIECVAYKAELLEDVKLFIGNIKGRLAYKPKGSMQNHLWSPMAMLFIPEGYGKTLAEMDIEEYLEWYLSIDESGIPERMFAKWFMNLRGHTTW